MSDCKYSQFLSAHHDGELDRATSQEVESHVATCYLCAERLDRIRRMSGAILRSVDDRHAEFTPDAGELRRMHKAVARVAGEENARPLLRIAGAFSAVAASVLIISGVWLMELGGGGPRPAGGAPAPVAQAVASFPQPWEQVAMGGYVPPIRLQGDRGYEPGEPAVAYNDRELANDIFVGLSK